MDKLLAMATTVFEHARLNGSPREVDLNEFIQYIMDNFPAPDPDSSDYPDIVKDTKEVLTRSGRWADFPEFPQNIHPAVYPIAVIKLMLTNLSVAQIACSHEFITPFHNRYTALFDEALG